MGHFIAKQKSKNKPYTNLPKKKKVGKRTNLKTTANRDVYITEKGEPVSEKGVTIPIGADTTTGEEVWLNAPSIYDGYLHTEDEVIDKFQKDDIPRNEMSFHGSSQEGIQASEKRSKSLKIVPK